MEQLISELETMIEDMRVTAKCIVADDGRDFWDKAAVGTEATRAFNTKLNGLPFGELRSGLLKRFNGAKQPWIDYLNEL